MDGGYLTASYEPVSVAMSVAVAIYASFITLALIQHVREAPPRSAWLWLGAGSLVLGTGIWTMHFIGMLAFRLPLALGYRELQTVVSWLAAVAVSFVALHLTTRKLGIGRLTAGAVSMGAGICAMHYTGMAAIDLSPAIAWNPWLVLASAAIAVGASAAALLIFFWLPRRGGRGSLALQFGAATVLGLAISGMHYTGMAAAGFPAGAVCFSADAISTDRLALPILAACAILLIAFDTYLHSRTERSEKLAQSLQEANRALTAARDQAHAASRAKSEFLANMSHEIRTPMNAIIGLTDVVLDGELDARQRDYLEKVHGAASALLGLLNDILDYSKIEAGRLQVERIAFPIEQTLAGIAGLFGPQIEHKGLELLFDVAAEVPRRVVSDPLRLSQVLNNLVGNAIKFTDTGSVIVRVDLAPERPDGGLLRFAVRDTGIGLDEAEAEGLFEAFAQADASTSRRYGGSGLGLAICRRLVQMMGGTITVQGRRGAGCCFTFTIDAPAAADHEADAGTAVLHGRNVLIVDDHESARTILRSLCMRAGLRADVADGGAAGLVRLAEARRAGQPYEVLLVDWKMPGMDGLEMVRRLRASAPSDELPLAVMVTAYGRAQLLDDAGDLALDALLVKPVVASSLHEVLTRLLPSAPPAAHGGDTAAAPRVLLVEDNPVNQSVAIEYLRALGVEPRIASDGRQALVLIDEATFDLVLMDLHMPVMDGYEATRRIVGRGPDAPPVVAMTAAVMEEDRRRCAEAGMVDFIAKPIRREAIRAVLVRWLPRWTPPAPTPRPGAGGDRKTASGEILGKI